MNGIYMPEAWGDWYNFPEDSVPIMTYSKMAHLIKGRGNSFGLGMLKHIVLDECHNLKIYQSFSKPEDNVLIVLENWLKNVMLRTDIKITALSATPKKIYVMFKEPYVNNILSETERKSLRTLKNKYEKKFASMSNMLSNLPVGRGVIYTSHIHKMKEYSDLIRKLDNKKNVEMIWSRNNDNHVMDNRQWEIWDSILRKSAIPDETRQKQGLQSMKERGEWDKYGRPAVMDFKRFSEEYSKVKDGTEKPFDLMRRLDMKKATFYQYAKRYNAEYATTKPPTATE